MQKKFKLKEKSRTIEYPAFEYTIEIIVTNSIPESYLKRFGYKFETPGHGSLSGTVAQLPSNRTSVVFIDTDSTRDLNDVIAHECYHSIRNIEKALGNSNGGEEWFAYQLGYLVGQVHNLLNAKK